LVPSWAGFGVIYRKAAEHVFLYDGKLVPKNLGKNHESEETKVQFR